MIAFCSINKPAKFRSACTPVCDVAVAQHRGLHKRAVVDTHSMVQLIALTQTSQDGHSLCDGGLIDIHLWVNGRHVGRFYIFTSGAWLSRNDDNDDDDDGDYDVMSVSTVHVQQKLIGSTLHMLLCAIPPALSIWRL
eukprot:1139692-Pelagomonas_calceolata.AAC.4